MLTSLFTSVAAAGIFLHHKMYFSFAEMLAFSMRKVNLKRCKLIPRLLKTTFEISFALTDKILGKILIETFSEI